MREREREMVAAGSSRRRRRRRIAVLLFLVIVVFISLLFIKSPKILLAQYLLKEEQFSTTPRIADDLLQFGDGNNLHRQKNNRNISVDTTTSSADSDRCSRILLYDTDLVDKDTGVGHRLAFYSLAAAVAATTDSALVLLEPPLDDENKWANVGGSPFGCPVINDGRDDNDTSCDRLPTGLSRIIHVPEMLSRGCSVPMNLTCTIANQNTTFMIQSRQDWSRIVLHTQRRFGFPEVICNHNNNNNMTMIAIGGVNLKYYWIDKVRPRLVQRFLDGRNSTKQRRMKWERWMENWSTRMGATMGEVHEYTRTKGIINNKKTIDSAYVEEYNLMDYLIAVLNRAEVPMFQPWVVNDFETYLRKIDLPQSSSSTKLLFHGAGGGYEAMHIRRGDSLNRGQSIQSTEEYWVQQGYPARDNKTDDIATLSIYPTNYVPFVKYWEQYATYKNCNLGNTSSSVQKMYIATDDINTVKSEIENLVSTHRRQFWTVCNKSVEFMYNPEEEHTTHLHQHLDPNTLSKNGGNTTVNSHDQYSRALTALVDLQILARSDVFVGDHRSYFSRLLRMLRTSFQGNRAHTRDIVIAWGDSNDSNYEQPPWK